MVWHIGNWSYDSATFAEFGVFPHPLQRCVMPLVGNVGGDFFPVGTAFAILPNGLLMTAAHVLVAAHDKGVLRRNEAGKITHEYGLYALWVTDEKDENGNYIGGPLPVDRVYVHEALDIGFCWLGPLHRGDVQQTFPVMQLDLSIPPIGSRVCGFGYYAMKVHSQGDSTAPVRKVEYEQKTAVTTGKVVEVHRNCRDKTMLRYPCFQVDCRFDPGMSGGPVLNETGGVCGVVCSALDGAAPDYVSYASLIWPALAVNVEVRLEEDGPLVRVPVLSLIDKQILGVKGPLGNVVREQGPNGSLVLSFLG